MPLSLDLYLGGDLGLWALSKVPPAAGSRVISFDSAIVDRAREIGMAALIGDANALDFHPADVALSVHYPRILNSNLISSYQQAFNLHPGFLPWGRGFYPVFWALWEQTPAGATLHEMTPMLDKGPVVAQIRVDCNSDDTGATLYARVRNAEKRIFREYAPRILNSESFPSVPQAPGGTYHSRKEFFELKSDPGWESMGASDMLRLLRAFTFPPHSGPRVVLGGSEFQIRLEPFACSEISDDVRNMRNPRQA